jgi:sarcosine oxidase
VEIVVVGAGVTGAAAAWRLAGRGHEVLVLERFGPGHDRGASHGSARIYRQTATDPRYVALAVEALTGWRELERETGAGLLAITGGADHGDPDATAALAASLAAQGVRYEWLEADEAARLWPGRLFEGRVLYQPDRTGRVHADHAVAAFGAAAVGQGAVVRHRVTVEDLRVRGPNRVDVRTSAGPVRARRVVVAAGAESVGLLAGRFGLPPLRVTRERTVHLARAAYVPAGPTFLHHTGAEWPRAVYGVPVPDGRIEVGFHGVGPRRDQDTAAAPARLLNYAARYLPGFEQPSADVVECAYTSTPDSGFALVTEGPLTVGAGLSGHGFTFAPAIGRVLADLATGVSAESPVGAR